MGARIEKLNTAWVPSLGALLLPVKAGSCRFERVSEGSGLAGVACAWHEVYAW